MSAMKRIKLGQERECLCGQGSLSGDGIFKLRPDGQRGTALQRSQETTFWAEGTTSAKALG